MRLSFSTRLVSLALACAMPVLAPAFADDASDLKAASARGKKLYAAGAYSGAAKEFERAIALSSRVHGAKSKDTAVEINNLAAMYYFMGEFAKAEPLYLRSLKISEADVGSNHPEVATSLNNLAALYRERGQYQKAIELMQRGLAIRKSQPGGGDPALVAGSINNIATLYGDLGQPEKSEAMLLECLRIYIKKFGPKDRMVAGAYDQLGSFYREMGLYAKSEPMFSRALTLFEAKLGPNHPQVALVLDNFGKLYRATKEYGKAEKMYLRSLKIREAKLGKNHPDVADTLSNLSGIYYDQKQYAKAEPLEQRSLAIREAKFGPENLNVAFSLNNLAKIFSALNQRGRAAAAQGRALRIHEAQLAPDHPATAAILLNSAVLDIELGSIDRAAERLERSRRIVRRHISRVLPGLNEKDQLAFLENTDRRLLHGSLSIALDSQCDAALRELTAGWLANAKAVAQDTLAQRQLAALSSDDAELQAVATQLQSVRSELATLAMAKPRPGQEAARIARLAALEAEELSASKTVAAARGQAVQDDPWVEIDTIRRVLPPGAMLLDIARIKVSQFDADGPPKEPLPFHYIAWLVPATGAGEVQVVNLGLADKIEAAISAYQAEMAEAQTGTPLQELGEIEAETLLAKQLSGLAKLVFEPLRPHLADAKQLVLSPDASLWLVPWAALPIGDDRYLIQRWPIRFVVAGREVALEKMRKQPTPPGPPRIFANPSYDAEPSETLAAYNAIFARGSVVPIKKPSDARPKLDRRTQNQPATQIGRAQPLPGTAAEAASIAPKLKAYTGAPPKTYSEAAAQEAVFKRLQSPQVLLVSTHGFFLPDPNEAADEDAEKPVASRGATSENRGASLDNPLLRCGLLFAGCNQAPVAGKTASAQSLGDGVLTGLEIIGTDLRGTDLVVLSACETGLGQVNNGEGVAGLRQAFQLSGARSVVSTLWQIPDKQSAQLMTQFFSNLAAGQSKSEALRGAQLATIEARRERNGAAHPLFWAAWTITGAE